MSHSNREPMFNFSFVFQGFFVRHPTLGVPICKACKSFYFEGSWRKDEDGKFEYCGWCAQGGELLCCAKDSCPNAFCLKCIKRNLGRKAVTKIEDTDEWECFECKPSQLTELRLLYYSILQFWRHFDEKLKAKKAKKAQKEENCISKSIAEATSHLYKQISLFRAVNCSDKLEAAENFAKLLALNKKNLSNLQENFFDNLKNDLGADQERDEKLRKIAEDLSSVSNGDLKEVFDLQKKEKVKYEVLKSSDEETDLPNGTVSISESDTSPAKKPKKAPLKVKIGSSAKKSNKESSSEEEKIDDSESDKAAADSDDSDFDYKDAKKSAQANITPKKKKVKKEVKLSSDEEEADNSKNKKSKKNKDKAVTTNGNSNSVKEEVLKDSSDDLFEKSEDETDKKEAVKAKETKKEIKTPKHSVRFYLIFLPFQY